MFTLAELDLAARKCPDKITALCRELGIADATDRVSDREITRAVLGLMPEGFTGNDPESLYPELLRAAGLPVRRGNYDAMLADIAANRTAVEHAACERQSVYDVWEVKEKKIVLPPKLEKIRGDIIKKIQHAEKNPAVNDTYKILGELEKLEKEISSLPEAFYHEEKPQSASSLSNLPEGKTFFVARRTSNAIFSDKDRAKRLLDVLALVNSIKQSIRP